MSHEGFVWCVAFSPDGKTLAAGYSENNATGPCGVVLWDVAARKRLVGPPLSMEEDMISSVTFSPDGKTLAAGRRGSGVSSVVLWDVATHKGLVNPPLAVEEGYVESVAFSPDGKSIAAGYRLRGVVVNGGGGVVLWDVATRKRLMGQPLAVEAGNVESVAFSPDGKSIALGHGGGGVALWDIDPESWQRLAGRIANRNFTRKEWRDYFPETPYRATFPDLPVPPEVAPK